MGIADVHQGLHTAFGLLLSCGRKRYCQCIRFLCADDILNDGDLDFQLFAIAPCLISRRPSFSIFYTKKWSATMHPEATDGIMICGHLLIQTKRLFTHPLQNLQQLSHLHMQEALTHCHVFSTILKNSTR